MTWEWILRHTIWHFCRGHATYKSPCRSVSWSVGLSVRRSVGPSHFAFLVFLGILRVGRFVFEHALAQIMTAPAQIITAPAQIIIAPAHRPRQERSCLRPCWFSKRIISNAAVSFPSAQRDMGQTRNRISSKIRRSIKRNGGTRSRSSGAVEKRKKDESDEENL